MSTDTMLAPPFLTDPAAVICETITAIEPTLPSQLLVEIVGKVAPKRARLRQLAQALHEEPDLLTSGQPRGPRSVAALIAALQSAGAQHVSPPLCARCQQPRALLHPQPDGDRICDPCRSRAQRELLKICHGCGRSRRVEAHDPRGPLCSQCAKPERSVDHLDRIHRYLLARGIGLSAETLHQVIAVAVPNFFQQRDIGWELDTHPQRLGRLAGHGSHRMVVLTETLVAAGALGIEVPQCPTCGRTVSLRFGRDEQRCCRACYDAPRKTACQRCGHVRVVATRSHQGEPLCNSCTTHDPINLELCDGCGRSASLTRVTGRSLCGSCWRGPMSPCSACAQVRPCHRTSTGALVCANCTNKRRKKEECSNCTRQCLIKARLDDGRQLCEACNRDRTAQPCTRCQRTMRVAGRTTDGTFCKRCWRKEPAAHRACIRCGITSYLHRLGLCDRCAAPAMIRDALTSTTGTVRTELRPLQDLLTSSNPTTVILWLRRGHAYLQTLANAGGPLTHDILDGLLPVKAARWLRNVLVANALLPQRDEYLLSLEKWFNLSIDLVSDQHTQRLLRSFFTWYYLRRLRQRNRSNPVTFNQATVVKNDIRAAIRLLSWLAENNLTLASCTQTEIDTWLTSGYRSAQRARNFLNWMTERGHTNGVKIPNRPQAYTREVFPEADQRWAMAQRLLTATEIAPADRLAALLVLLYAQRLSSIAALKLNQIQHRPDGRMQLHLGREPIDLPDQVAAIVDLVMANRKGHGVVGQVPNDQWLFPGLTANTHLSAVTLLSRLKPLGLSIRVARNTALMSLAAELPPVVLSKLLGLSLGMATQWAEQAGHSRPGYAAVVSRRS